MPHCRLTWPTASGRSTRLHVRARALPRYNSVNLSICYARKLRSQNRDQCFRTPWDHGPDPGIEDDAAHLRLRLITSIGSAGIRRLDWQEKRRLNDREPPPAPALLLPGVT